MPLFARRMALLGSENAFRMVPLIHQAEASGLRVVRCNVGEPDFPTPGLTWSCARAGGATRRTVNAIATAQLKRLIRFMGASFL